MIYTKLTQKAMQVAYNSHETQTDKSYLPYILHPLHVAEQMDDEYSTCVALLHDVLEDTDVTLSDLRELGFPEEVIEAVSLLTHDKSVPYMDYIHEIKKNPLATKVKIADLKHNSDLSRLLHINEKDYQRVKKYEKALQLLIEPSNKTITKTAELSVDIKYARIGLRVAGYNVNHMTDEEIFEKAISMNDVYAVSTKIIEKEPVRIYSPKEGDNTGFKDIYGNPIYVGDIVEEGCNGFQARVTWDYKRGSFWLQGLGEGYGIADSHIEWKIIEPYDKTRTLLSEELTTKQYFSN